MLKNFRLIVTVLVVTASSFGAVAQTETKDVVLDGKPAKLNVKTGEVKLVELKTINGKRVEIDSTAPKTVIQANLITTSKPKDKSEKKNAALSKPDTLSNPIENIIVPVDTSLASKNEPSKKVAFPTKVEKATTLVYDTSLSNEEANANSDYHKVKQGETLYALSKRYSVSLADLKRVNGLNTTLIKTGQTLRVKNFESLHDVWVVSKGDTLYSIAKKTNTTVASIKALNGLLSNLIKPGQKLQLK